MEWNRMLTSNGLGTWCRTYTKMQLVSKYDDCINCYFKDKPLKWTDGFPIKAYTF